MLVSFCLLLVACAPQPTALGPDDDVEGLDHSDALEDSDPSVVEAEVPYDGVDNDHDPTTPDDDLDGDGFPLAEDCDDGNGGKWNQEGTYVGDLSGGFSWLCSDYCELTVDGDVDIPEFQDDLSQLACLVEVTGDFDLDSVEDLTSLSGLESFRSIGGRLSIERNPVLTDLSALSGLETVGSIGILWNDAAIDLSGLATVLDRDPNISFLQISGNPGLESLRGLEGLTSFGGSIGITGNDALRDISALANLESVAGSFELVATTDSLQDVSAIGKIRTVGDNLWFASGTAEHLDCLGAVETIGGDLLLYENAELVDLSGLGSLAWLGGRLHVADNPKLENLEALASWLARQPELPGGIYLSTNEVLRDLSGLEGVNRLAGSLFIIGNDSLVDISALAALSVVDGNVTITGNPLLSDAAATTLFESITVGGTITIQDNGP